MTKEVIYFDNNATTKIDLEVLEAMNSSYKFPLNSSSAHQFGQIAAKHINDARAKIANLVNGINYEIILCSGATESNNLALRGLDNFKIITFATEHAAVLETAKKEDALILDVKTDGLVDLVELEKTLENQESKDFLVSIMIANNETGLIQNIKEIAKLTHQYGGLIHSDITQGVGKIDIDLEDLNIDLASFSAHKIFGPQGIGALLVKKPLQINPLIYGGKQEDGKRAGTSNIAGIVGFGEACKLSQENLANYQKILELRDYLELKLKEIAGNDVLIFCQTHLRLPNTSFFATKNLDNQTLMISLDMNNIAVSIGSACSSGVAKSSHVLKAMNIDENTAKTAIRVSLSKDNSKLEIDKFINIWQELYNKNN